jgi:hypothetical protein
MGSTARDQAHSPASAFDPTIAQLPGGDLAVVVERHAATAHASSTIARASSRVDHGAATHESSGDSRSPSLAADPNGGLHLAWIYNDGGNPRLFFPLLHVLLAVWRIRAS